MQWQMQVLTDIGRPDVAYQIATRTDRPSWGYMVSKGATTSWERWDTDTQDGGMNGESQKILSGNFEAWCYQTLAGINYDPEQPGFKHIVLAPASGRRSALGPRGPHQPVRQDRKRLADQGRSAALADRRAARHDGHGRRADPTARLDYANRASRSTEPRASGRRAIGRHRDAAKSARASIVSRRRNSPQMRRHLRALPPAPPNLAASRGEARPNRDFAARKSPGNLPL